jgi:hypothetical protein
MSSRFFTIIKKKTLLFGLDILIYKLDNLKLGFDICHVIWFWFFDIVLDPEKKKKRYWLIDINKSYK